MPNGNQNGTAKDFRAGSQVRRNHQAMFRGTFIVCNPRGTGTPVICSVWAIKPGSWLTPTRPAAADARQSPEPTYVIHVVPLNHHATTRANATIGPPHVMNFMATRLVLTSRR